MGAGEMRTGWATRRAMLAFVGAVVARQASATAQSPTPPGDPRLNNHPYLPACLQHLNAKRWADLTTIVRNVTPDSACVLLDDLGDQSDVDLDLAGLTDNAMGETVAGALLVNWGWRYRGTGWARSVTNEMAQAFAERLRTARSHLEQANVADPNDGVAYSFLFQTLKGLSEVQAMATAWPSFQRAERKPIRAYVAFADALTPRWFGSEEYLVGFARTHQAALEPTSHALICYAANEMILSRLRSSVQTAIEFASQAGVLGEVGAAHDAFLAGAPDQDLYRVRFAHGHFSFFFSLLGLHDLARPHLAGLIQLRGSRPRDASRELVRRKAHEFAEGRA